MANQALLSHLDAVHHHIDTAIGRVGHNSRLAAALRGLVEQDLARKQDAGALPLLPLLTCELVGGDSHVAIPVAAAWNLLHLAAQIFDDLQDGEVPPGDKERGRGGATATASIPEVSMLV